MRLIMALILLPITATDARAVLRQVYDMPVIHAYPGETVPVTATLSLGLGDPGINTDANGNAFDSNGNLLCSVGASQIWDTEFCFISCPPGVTFENNSSWTPPGHGVGFLANLTIAPGGSSDVNLGTFTLDPLLPSGVYPTGIEVSVIPLCSGLCVTFLRGGPPRITVPRGR